MFKKIFVFIGLFSVFSFSLVSKDSEGLKALLSLNDAFIEISEKVNPSIVYIQTGEEVEVQRNSQIPFEGWPFDDSYQFPFQIPQEESPQQFWKQGAGSGFIVSKDGLILTNNHVVGTADEINVTMFDGKVYEASLIGVDPSTDVALIKIDTGANLPYLKMDLESEIKVGQWVLAFGNPLQLRFTVTSGIVSAVGRNLGLLRSSSTWAIEDFIQTDAAINPGNSGGPLVNLRGKVIGINSALVSDTGSFSGYSFAIPIKLAKRVMDDLVEFGEVRRAVLGVLVSPITDLDREALSLPENSGVLISGFVNSEEGWSPAERSQLKQLDVIWKIDGKEVRSPALLQKIISSYSPGDTVNIEIFRGGYKDFFDVVLGTAPKPKKQELSSEKKIDSNVLESIGIEAQDVSFQDLLDAGWENPPKEGLVIVSIRRGSSAHKRGMLNFVGFIITHIGEYEIQNMNEALDVLKNFESGAIVYFDIVGPDGYPSLISIRIP